MLIVERKINQKIQIGNDVVITVTKLKSGRISLGIEAPPEISIRRGEQTKKDVA